MDVGGFRPPEDPFVSWFGKVNLALPGERWPDSAGQPMHALCQLNLAELPFRPPHLDDLAMITVFIGPSQLPVDQPNGDNCGVYENISGYFYAPALLSSPPGRTRPIKTPFPCVHALWRLTFPSLDDVSEMGIDVGDEEEYGERCHTADGLKLGGWPSLIQSTIYWPSKDEDRISPQYVFQIDTCEKAHWQWGDAGVGYFGRGSADGFKDEWTLTWQCL